MKLNRKILKLFTIFMLIQLCLTSTVTYPLHHMQQTPLQTHHLQQEYHEKSVIYHNMRNFHFSEPRHALHLTSNSQTHAITSMGYFFTLGMIVEGIPYRLNIDTGSSDIFIKGEQSAGNPSKKYSCSECLKKNKQYSVSYLDGTLDTYVQQANIEFGKNKFKENILVAYYAPKNFEKPEGLVGLSFPKLARNPNPTFIQTLINNKIINKYAFGVNLNFQNNQTSSINFGQPDHKLYEGELKKVKIMSSHSYQINMDSLQIGNGPHLNVQSALLDTGNSCISVPSRFRKFILDQFNAGGDNKCDFDKQPFAPMFSLLRCRVKDFEKLPSVKIFIDKTMFEVDHNAYTQRCVWEGKDSLCDFYIESVDHHNQLFIGDGFFNRFYTYFDIDNNQIGIAKNKENLSYKNMYKSESTFDSQDRSFFKALK